MALHRPRESRWPAIPMDQAWAMLEEKFGEHLDQLRVVEERRANDPELLGAVLAEPLFALRPVPSFRASIKDGYAVIATDDPGPRRVVAVSTAGGREGKAPFDRLRPGQCVRISTGAKVPEGADAVAQVEDTKLLEDDGRGEELLVHIGSKQKKGQDIREVGSDVAEGELLLDKGARLGPAEIGLLALSGREKVLAFRTPRISVLSTGDELVDFFGKKRDAGNEPDAVMDTNRPVLLSLLRQNGVEGIDCGIVEDSQEKLIEAMEGAFRKADILVLTGGVSMGEKDLLKGLLRNHFQFQIHFGRVFMKPGLPSTFASGIWQSDGRCKLVFGLPGNPVSAFVTAHLFLLPQLRRIAGQDVEWHNPRIAVQLAESIPRLDIRPEYRRALLLRSPLGHFPSIPPSAQCISGSQISSRLLSTRSANLLLELPANSYEKEGMEEGELVAALVIGPI